MRYEATLPLPELRKTLQAQVNAIRAEKIRQGLQHGGETFACDPETLGMMFQRVQTGKPCAWRTVDNRMIPFKGDTLRGLYDRAASRYASIMEHSFALKDAIEASDSPSSINLHEGWP